MIHRFGKELDNRDAIAVAAMHGDLASQSAETGIYSNDTDMETLKLRARLYYRMADALIEVSTE